ncbi:hypothetical protein [Synechococcus elongatus]|uniref:DUF2157 domain-containing protein n=1 Tax=Synechococcus elongatus (strain ATCC 33912 / PCC 7942 / FACHB-805) TaxID=1140 RepID=Q31KF8_SYNE7|nr:hypothetical protein [Synechococcus elongatus]ABB58461.1 conserved hypothetical protein [Synechococcus elongatus PCC 7942 = FACHB-805]AJD57078.1 hypothetical protein M744_04090 [Synechococcus elongatus UTEX 2973]MBD2587181.1 hypothetical protein [Synechococcus elongatus FACHB-242]MBD2688252.1 hypothetical protein [Synechococcus elongatus FACHB-1061]MBD2706037.1 hypothetical protein [Synechococcus elongatus PCC 7942 = FACHB-805]
MLPLPLDLRVDPDDPRVLEGLDALLQLQLIDHDQVLQVARRYLSSPLPVPKVAPVAAITPASVRQPVPQARSRPKQPSRWQRVWASFADELSVRWLLFLGVFLVVLSSGVLVATQWTYFPAIAQYLVLWSYTLLFWGCSRWAARQSNLTLTATSLEAVALLLLPFNFWAIDGLVIRSEGPGLALLSSALAILAAGILLAIAHRTYRQSDYAPPLFWSLIGLLLCQLGWQTVWPAQWAVYGAVLLCLGLLPNWAGKSSEGLPRSGQVWSLFALGVILLRAIAAESVPISSLGIAIALLGWLLWSEPRRAGLGKDSLERLGAGLILLAWWVTIGWDAWQALGVTAIAEICLVQRLKLTRRSWTLIALFGIGLLGCLLLEPVIPETWRQGFVLMVAQDPEIPLTVYSLTLLPYVLIWLGVALSLGWRWQQSRLSRVAEQLAFGLGVVLALLSLFDPWLRSLVWTTDALLLAGFTYGSRPQWRPRLLTLTYWTGLIAIVFWVSTLTNWSTLLPWGVFTGAIALSQLGLMAWRPRSAHHQHWWRQFQAGALLLSVSSALLLGLNFETPLAIVLLWFLLPLGWTGLAARFPKPRSRRRRLALTSSLLLGLGCLLAAVITLESSNPLRVLQLAFLLASLIQVANVRFFPVLPQAVYHGGLLLCLEGLILLRWPIAQHWWTVGAFTVGVLWLLRTQVQRLRNLLGRIYSRAAAGWGLAIAIALLVSYLPLYVLGRFSLVATATSAAASTAFWILSAVTIARYWRRPTSVGVVLWAVTTQWAIAATAQSLVSSGSEVAWSLAIANLLLAGVSVGSIPFLPPRFSRISLVRWLPLLAVGLGLVWRLGLFNAYSGATELLAATVIFTQHRQEIQRQARHWSSRLLRLLGFVLISCGLYELLIYALLQSQGGNPIDGLLLLSLLGIAIAIVYRSLVAWRSRSAPSFYAIPLPNWRLAAHLHWGLASFIQLLTLPVFLFSQPVGSTLNLAVCLLLASYAWLQARFSPERSPSHWSQLWVYVGCLEAIGSAVQLRLLWPELAVLDPIRVLLIALLSLAMLQFPWARFGWQAAPWHRVAVCLPIVALLADALNSTYLGLIAVGLFYVRVAFLYDAIRWTYISLLVVNWIFGKLSSDLVTNEPLIPAMHLGLSILYIAQVDPALVKPQARSLRHFIRILGSGLICLTALLFYRETGFTPILVSLLTVLLGLGLQIRALLYVGTSTFVLTGAYHLILWMTSDAFAKWVAGLVIGIVLISLAANFERHRLQITKTTQSLKERLTSWE